MKLINVANLRIFLNITRKMATMATNENVNVMSDGCLLDGCLLVCCLYIDCLECCLLWRCLCYVLGYAYNGDVAEWQQFIIIN